MVSKRLALGAAWLAAALAGGLVTVVVSGAAVAPLFVALLLGNAPSALVLAVAARRWDWSPIVAGGWLLLSLLDYYAVTPGLNHLLAPFSPVAGIQHMPAQLPPRSAYLPVWIAYFTAFGLVKGALTVALLWWYLRARHVWVGAWTLAGFVTALTVYWQLYLPVPGEPQAGLYTLGPLVQAAAVAMLWRFDANPPALRPGGLVADLEPEVEPAAEPELGS